MSINKYTENIASDHIAGIKQIIEKVGSFQIIASVFSHMGDATRVRIFWLLCHCELCVSEIADMLNMSSPAISHHLRPLKNSGLIKSRRSGKEVLYSSSDVPQSRLLHEMIEEVMEISCPDMPDLPEITHDSSCIPGISTPKTVYQEEQLETIRQIHDELSLHLSQRLKVEDLAHKYLMNPTTLKALFKEVYGNSLAAHMREHRMEEAARLLRETSMSINEIALAVGYNSQSKFTESFKKMYNILPKDYRSSE